MRQTLADSKCLAFFKFNSDNVIINSSGEPTKLANLCKDGPNANLKGFSWQAEYSKDLEINQKGFTQGSLQQEESLFDGLACKDQHKVSAFASNRSYISGNLTLSESVSSLTVEFWFKLTQKLE